MERALTTGAKLKENLRFMLSDGGCCAGVGQAAMARRWIQTTTDGLHLLSLHFPASPGGGRVSSFKQLLALASD
jgi:hypothetical protein